MVLESKHLRADERRDLTVRTVVDLAAEQNPSEITTAAIAKRMNVTQGALFRHFPNKDAILEAVVDWVADRLLRRLDEAAAGASGALDALEAMFMAHIEFIVLHPGVPRMLFGQLQSPGSTPAKRMAKALLKRYSERLHKLMEQGKQSGGLDADLDVDNASVLFIGTIQGLVMQSLIAGNVAQMRAQAPAVFAIFRRGIGVQP
ncbi:MAG: TetR/AcrR family transcriptional regulator [Gammaproteobacteria bacterium]|jgi:AcrR family transcriptional regulator|nr:TetR/AcrR family transcriptional regulator [Gammaproteobacteria bacterium]MCW5585167.1 TetR/AcrR family transcriptional regulator [Chromatiales bacterium]HOP16344.1 TetR/AcrR family transcriptional regulator [Gammaproteobacteria bacterium]HPQ25088.1 TetR/AcrR family transcriptional regulator [Gammaproteobacteria bacterium]HRX04425.1 TetR/AcrR family transcriptional regulator [Anaerolineae bacterium]